MSFFIFLPLVWCFCFFAGTGFLRMHEKEPKTSGRSILKNYSTGADYIFLIEEIARKERKWCRMKGEILAVRATRKINPCEGGVILYFKGAFGSLKPGDRVVLNNLLLPIANKGNPGEFDAAYYWKNKAVTHIGFVEEGDFCIVGKTSAVFFSQRLRDYLKSVLAGRLQGQILALAQALLLGERGTLEQETINAFGNTGAMHILAVSGLHVGIIFKMIQYLLSSGAKFISKKKALIIALLVLWFYAFVTGFSISVIRACFMFSILALSQVIGKNYNPFNALFFSAFILLVWDPLYLFDLGFQLSYLAMVGIFLFFRPLSQIWYFPNLPLRKVWEGMSVGLAAQLLTTPLILHHFHQFPNYFIFTNLGIMVSSTLILAVGMFAMAFHWVSFLGSIAFFILFYSLVFTLEFIGWIENVPGAVAFGYQLNELSVLIIYGLILAITRVKKNIKGKVVLLCLSFSFLFYITLGRFQNSLRNEVCFFNSSKVLVLIKRADRIFCFYEGDSQDFKKIERLIEAYTKVFPGEISYFSLKDKEWRLNYKGLVAAIEKVGKGFRVQINKEGYFIRKRSGYCRLEGIGKVINMPYLKGRRSGEYDLKEGAVRFSIP